MTISDRFSDPLTGTVAQRFEAEDLGCRRAGRVVFEGLGFTLEPGDALVLRGPNGSGKSSLLRLLAGFLQAPAGSLRWGGAPVGADPAAHRARLHYVGHLDAVKARLSVDETLRFWSTLLGRGGPAPLEPLALGDLADTPGRFLSSGQRRRVALSRLFTHHRPLWLLDEPAVGLDRASRVRLEGSIEEHRRAGGLAVVATHGDVRITDPLVLDLGG